MNRLTWADGKFSTKDGYAGGVRLFAITWKTHREDPSWLMRSDLPGLTGREWKDNDIAVLQDEAEELLALWLAKVNGLPAQEAEGTTELPEPLRDWTPR
jgi:hypothetical protein